LKSLRKERLTRKQPKIHQQSQQTHWQGKKKIFVTKIIFFVCNCWFAKNEALSTIHQRHIFGAYFVVGHRIFSTSGSSV